MRRRRSRLLGLRVPPIVRGLLDRKSTRLNSSHANISYAVFCLKKKTEPPSRPGADGHSAAKRERYRGISQAKGRSAPHLVDHRMITRLNTRQATQSYAISSCIY